MYQLLELRTNGVMYDLSKTKCTCISILLVLVLETNSTPTEKQLEHI